jgi:hypothetical protein
MMKSKKAKFFSNVKGRSKPVVVGVAVVGGMLAIGLTAQAASLDGLGDFVNKLNVGVNAVKVQLEAATAGITQVFSQNVKDKTNVDSQPAWGETNSFVPDDLEGQAGIAAPNAEVPTNFNTASLILAKGEAAKILSKTGQAARKKQLDGVNSWVQESYENAKYVYDNSQLVENMDSSQDILKVIAYNDVSQTNIAYTNSTLLAKSYELQQAGLQQAAVNNQLQAAALSNSMGSLQQQKILNSGLGYAAEKTASDLGSGEKK